MTTATLDIEELIGAVADGWERYQRANADRIGAALDVGGALIDLRERLAHGEFLPAVARLGIPDRTGRDWMRLARAGLKPATVADMGGIRAALEYLRTQAKTGDEIRAIELDADSAARRKKLGEWLAGATPEQLETYAELLRVQAELTEGRQRINELVTENDGLQQKIEARKREIQDRTAEIARLTAEIEKRRN